MKKNRIIALILVFTMCMVVFSEAITIKTSAALTGSGTQSDPYIINSSSDLSRATGYDTYSKLGQDIYISGSSWTPITLYGVLDGDGHTIKISRRTESATDRVALFSSNNGTIRNLNVHCEIYHKFYSPSSNGKMGGICITNNGIIENCNVTGSLEGIIFHTSYKQAYVGGICETNAGTIQDCGIYAEVRGSSYSSYCSSYASGVCVTNDTDAIITRCVVKNYVFGEDGGGGIAQYNRGTISECCIASSLSGFKYTISNGGTVENCISFSTQGYGVDLGVGYTNCINAGSLSYSGTTIPDSANNSYDIGNLRLVNDGRGLVGNKTYTESDFPALDFEKIWYITDYGVPYLRNLNLPKPQSVNIKCNDKLYVGGTTNAEVEILPKNAVLYSLSCSFTEGEHEAEWGVSYARSNLDIKPVSVGNTRLVISDAIAGVLGFKNFNFAQGVESITVIGPTRMGLGQTIKLTAVANPSNAENTKVKFVEPVGFLPRRLTVSEDGRVTANYLGDAWLYVQSEDGNVSITYNIVVAKLPTSVKLSDTKLTLYPGEEKQLSATVLPTDSEDKSYRWTSSNPAVATVDSNGKVKTVDYGTAVIKAICNDGGAYGECVVTVVKRPEILTLTGPSTIVAGETATYKLELSPSDAVIREAFWEVSDENIIKINQIDLTTVEITALAGGEAQITCTSGDHMRFKYIDVIRYPDSVKISEDDIYMTVGQQKFLSAQVSPEDTTDKTVTWTSDNKSVATVLSNGKIIAHKVGEATITCTTADGKKSDQVLVRVQIPATALEVEETDITLYVDETRKINATIKPDDATYKNAVLTPNNNLLEVDQETMTIRGLRAGTCILQVSTPDGSLTKKVFVTILEANHVYSDPVFTWNADYTECTAQRTCVNACPHTQTLNCAITKTERTSTCTKEGTIAYTASVEFDDELYEETKSVTIPKTNHIYSEPFFTWNADYTECTAQRTCVNACSHSLIHNCTVTNTIKKAATCTKEGQVVYTASVWIDGELYEDTKNATISKTDHMWNAATCFEPETCKECGATRGSKQSHSYTDGCDDTCNACETSRTAPHTYKTTTTKATLTKNGKIVKKCSKCGTISNTTTIPYPKTIKLSTTTYTYNGKVRKPAVTVKDSAGKVLKKDTDYTVSYEKGRKYVGTYDVTIKFIGKYSGTKKLTFKINPVKTKISKLTPGKNSIKVDFSKKTTQVTGYQIQYSTTKSFSKATTKTITSNKTTRYTFKKLKSRKTYYIRVRTYKTVGKTKYYSSWSSYKSTKTK